MRLDKYLKVARIVKRRTVAKEMCSAGKVTVNYRPAKAGTEINTGDIITVDRGNNVIEFEILSTPNSINASRAGETYKIISERRKNS